MKTRKLLLTIIALFCLVQAKADVEITESNFPDANFRTYLLNQSYGSDGVITDAELYDVKVIDVGRCNISDLDGIQYFTELEALGCSYNNLTSLNVSNNTRLTSLECAYNQLTSLDLSNNRELTCLICSDNKIKGEEMDAFISSLPNVNNGQLYVFYDIIRGNIMTTSQVAIAKQKGWMPLYYDGSDFSEYTGSLPISIAVDEMNFPDTKFRDYLNAQPYGSDGVITDWEIVDILSMDVHNLQISSLKGIEFFTALTSLDCSDNKLTSLDVSKSTELTELYCEKNELTSLIISKGSKLTSFCCYSNQIIGDAIDALLENLPSANNRRTFNIIYNKNEGNGMTAAQVATAKAKGWIPQCYDGSDWVEYVSSIVGIDINETNFPDKNFRNYIKKQPYGKDGVLTDEEIANVKEIYVSNEQISNLKGIEFFNALTHLYCESNQLTSLDVSKNTALTELDCYSNQIKDDGMNVLIESLPIVKYGVLRIVNYYENEGNIITAAQVETVCDKGWDLDCYGVEVVINNNNFSDELRNYLTSQSYGEDGLLTGSELYEVKDIIVPSLNINSLHGLHYFGELTDLDFPYNNISSLDISQYTKLEYLGCSYNKFTTLDVSDNTALTSLYCDHNQIASLDASKNTELKTLWCNNNQLTTLVVSKNAALTELYCHNNQIKGEAMDALIASLPTVSNLELYIIGNENEGNIMTTTQVAAAKAKGWIPQCYDGSDWGEYAGAIEINETNFPDEGFRNYLIYFYGEDNVINNAEIAATTNMNISATSSLEGIQYFTALTSLNCRYSKLTSLDVSKNTALTNLDCSENELTTLDVSKNTALTKLNCGTNKLTSLDLTFNTALETLNCENNLLTLLCVSNNTALTSLYCNNNQLTTLDVSKNTELKTLWCNNNLLTTLDVSKNAALTELYCHNNQIKGEAMDALIASLPSANNSKLNIIYNNNEGNVMTIVQVAAAKAKGWTPQYYNGYDWVEYTGCDFSVKIDETNFPDENFRNYLLAQSYGEDGILTLSEIHEVKEIVVPNYNIYDLEGIQYFTELTTLDVSNNGLSSIDLQNNYVLKSLSCNNNHLYSLDVRNAGRTLEYLDCSYNEIYWIDDNDHDTMKYLNCSNNQLTQLNLSSKSALEYVDCSYNQLTSIYTSENTSLSYIDCSYNQLTALDISGTSLICSNNQFKKLDLSNFTGLTSLVCNSNHQLTSLDVSNCTSLTSLDCSNNDQFTSLDVSNCTSLTSLDCHGNELTTLDVSNCTSLTSLDCSGNELTTLDVSNCTSLTSLDCSYNQLTSIYTSEKTSLNYLDCSYNQFKELDLSNYTALTSLDCSSNPQLTSLDVSNCTSLTSLDCSNHQLTSLDVSNCTSLTSLDCHYNQLTSLDVSNCTSLTSLDCSSNPQLTSLDVSNCTSLTSLDCHYNQLTSLDVSKNTELLTIYCHSNQIKGEGMDALVASLPKTKNGSIRTIFNKNEGNEITTVQVAAAKAKGWIPKYYNGSNWVDYSGGVIINELNFPDENFRNYLKAQSYGKDGEITDLEINTIKVINIINKKIHTLKGIEHFAVLTKLYCSSNQLTTLDVSKNTALTLLNCSSNQLTSLDVSKNTALTSLNCSYNQLTTLDVSKNTALTSLNCSDNQLTALDVSKNTALTSLNCISNQLTALNVSKKTKLTDLYCYYNQLTSLDVSKNTALTSLNCSYNQLTTLDVSKNTALTSLKCSDNQLTALDVSKNTALTSLNCSSNQIKGEAMDALVESLPTVAESELKVINNNNEGNEMTTVQVAAAKAKGWIPQYYDGYFWDEYAGSPVEFKLTYMLNGEEYKIYDIEYGATITPEADLEKETYRFSGWSEIPKTMPAKDVIITGTFERYFTVGNVVKLVNFVTNGNATTDDVELYDQNSDGELNIGDIILVVKWILNNDNNGPSNSRTRSYDTPDWTQYTAAQFDVKTTSDTNIREIRLVKSMEQTHQMMYQQKDANTYSVVVYSLSNQLMKPENGGIVEIDTENGSQNGLSIENVIVALPTGETQSYSSGQTATNIQQIEGDGGPTVVYDLKGNRMNANSSLKKGVYIVNGKKVIVK